MKRLALALAVVLVLFGCYSHINKVKDKWGPPAKVEDRGDTLAHYYYFPVVDHGWGPLKGNTATAHKLARIVYRMLKYGTDYVDPGLDYY